MKSGKPSNGIQVISRAANILRALKSDNSGLSLGQLAKEVSLPRSTVQRIVNALVEERFIMASSSTSGYKLGPEIQSMAVLGKIDIAEQIRPILSELSKITQETVDLAVFKKPHMVFIDQIISPQRLRTVSAVGEIFPMCETANGKAVLAILEHEVMQEIVLNKFNQDPDQDELVKNIFKEIKYIQKTGIAYDRNEHTDGISAIGVAFSDFTGMNYAISVPVPSYRFEEKLDILKIQLKLALDKVTALIGNS